MLNRSSPPPSEPDKERMAVGDPGLMELLLRGRITGIQRVPWGTNYTFLVALESEDGRQALGIYKPRDGSRPLFDFDTSTLYKRELAAYRLCQKLGWNFVPPTVSRSGPYGIGSLQFFVDPDWEHDYFTLRDDHPEEMRRIALFDIVCNNADRKAGHCLKDRSGRIWAIDHGLTFHQAFKLRTVIWDFCGEPIPDSHLQDLKLLCEGFDGSDGVAGSLSDLLSDREVHVLRRRLEVLLELGEFPEFGPYRGVPWPLV